MAKPKRQANSGTDVAWATPKRRRRRVLARERGLVTSSIPPADRPARCKGCSTRTTAGNLRYGYGQCCWNSDGPRETERPA